MAGVSYSRPGTLALRRDTPARTRPSPDRGLDDGAPATRGVAYWRNVTGRVWDYTIGGYQVIKKWLSYREPGLLGRPLTPAEAREVRDMARRIAALLLLEPELDANYAATRADTYPWPSA